jgi:hypothetical protein
MGPQHGEAFFKAISSSTLPAVTQLRDYREIAAFERYLIERRLRGMCNATIREAIE